MCEGSGVFCTHELRLLLTGRFGIHIVDNLILVHHQTNKQTLTFDIKLLNSHNTNHNNNNTTENIDEDELNMIMNDNNTTIGNDTSSNRATKQQQPQKVLVCFLIILFDFSYNSKWAFMFFESLINEGSILCVVMQI